MLLNYIKKNYGIGCIKANMAGNNNNDNNNDNNNHNNNNNNDNNNNNNSKLGNWMGGS